MNININEVWNPQSRSARRAEDSRRYDRYDLFNQWSNDCRTRLGQSLNATLIIPLIYEDKLIGLISLGRKKSGKFYRREDVNRTRRFPFDQLP